MARWAGYKKVIVFPAQRAHAYLPPARKRLPSNVAYLWNDGHFWPLLGKTTHPNPAALPHSRHGRTVVINVDWAKMPHVMVNFSNFSTLSAAEAPQVIAQLKAVYHLAVLEQEAERQQVAAYLNDTAVQTLSALHIHFSLLHTTPDAQLRRELDQALPLLANLITGLTQLARVLRPLELDSFSLHEALQLAVESFSQTGKRVVWYEGHSVPDLPRDVATALYRLALATLLSQHNNSQATEGWLQLHTTHNGVCLIIQDNGTTAEPAPEILGLTIHFEQLNGRITHQVEPGIGTTITAVWPGPDAASQNPSGGNPVQNEPG